MLTLSPPTSLADWSLTAALRAEVAADPDLEAVRLTGSWGAQTMRSFRPERHLTLELADARFARLWFEGASGNLSVRELHVAGGSGTALKFVATDAATDTVHVIDSVIDGRGYARAMSIQGASAPDGSRLRHRHLTFTDTEMFGSTGDVAAVYGGSNVTFRRCVLRDATIKANTADHVDLLQVTDCVPTGDGILPDARWPVGLLVEECDLFYSAYPRVWGGPHQGIILSSGKSTGESIDGVVLRGNRLGASATRPGACIPGTGVLIASEITTRVRAYGNSTHMANGGMVVLDNVGDDVETWSNAFTYWGWSA